MELLMATKNYLELVNEVLIRLREDPVTGVNQNKYSRLIGLYVNDAKRQVEDAYNWNALSETVTVQTSPNLFNYILTDTGIRFRVLDVLNITTEHIMTSVPSNSMTEYLLGINGATVVRDKPLYYNFNGVDNNGDTQVDLYPIPDATYLINFNIIKPQENFTQDAQQIKVPAEPVIFLAYAKALAERGEDGGLSSSEAYALYLTSLADHIAIEGNKFIDEFIWEPR
jgi:hypothetical protein